MPTEPRVPDFDVAALASRLRRSIRGRVSAEPGMRALYATDASNYRLPPDLVVLPRDVDELATVVGLCGAAGAPLVVRGGGTSIAGNAIGGVVVDVSRHLTAIVALDPRRRRAVVEPGVVLSRLNGAAAAHGLVFGADPSSASRATLGGMIANNACGAHSVAWGTTADNLAALDVMLADGTRLELEAAGPGDDPAERRTRLLGRPGRAGELGRALLDLADREADTIRSRFAPYPRRISGYALDRLLPEHGHDLARLLCGSEGTLAVTMAAELALTPLPSARTLLVLGFPEAVAAADSVPSILPGGPLTVESVSAELLAMLPGQVRAEARAAGLPPGQTWLLVEVGGESTAEANARADLLATKVADTGAPVTAALVTEPGAQAVLWRCRRDAAGLATRRPDGGEAWPGWEDAAVPPERLGGYVRGLEELLGRYELAGTAYGHFGEGCLHLRIDFDLLTGAGVRRYRHFVEEATELVVSLGGSVSGEHGDGRARSELLGRMYGAAGLALFGRVKRAFDPTGVLNPHVIVDPRRLDADLRLGGRPPRELPVVLGYPDDGGSFAVAQRRCVGVGKCRQAGGGVMCPSYQVTREEQHSTRGRAHLLWEMVDGRLVTDGWRSEEVRDALDLCLSCKGCLSDCPVGVDIATYKAEFTYHHYRRRPWARPRSHWSLGWLPVWARLAAPAPGLANRLLGSGIGSRVRPAAGITTERPLPALAEQRFSTWFAGAGERRRDDRGRRPDLVLVPDTFTEHLSPEVGRAAVQVLESAGLAVALPHRPVCCGLTWMSTGQLGTARRVLRRTTRTLAPHLAAGRPVVGLEPSCTAMLRHDATRLLPGDPLAAALARSTRTFAEALTELAPGWTPPQVGGEALAQVHCHQHAVMGFGPDTALIAAAGIRLTLPDAGCCGLAGTFGFEPAHVEVSRAAGERVLLPAVRAAGPETAVLADGFSCRTQIEHGTGRRARHLAELLAAHL